ncbi:MAG: FAD/NAD(P)-binding oxidoreductase, partial [Clostridiales bacterium]|nr:FAD/NAD(P)-binding oxidoreductase [Clostridiales bacterium]
MYDVAIIGCGVIGAAAAFEISKYQAKLLILEKENDVAMGATRANSAIIHAGYDPKPGTLMAELNVKGNAAAEKLCEDLSVPFERIGSLVLAFSDEEMETVKALYERGVKNGVPGVKVLDHDEVKAMEPLVSDEVKGALYAPSAGIINPWDYCLAFAETAVVNGAELKLNAKVTGIEAKDG